MPDDGWHSAHDAPVRPADYERNSLSTHYRGRLPFSHTGPQSIIRSLKYLPAKRRKTSKQRKTSVISAKC